jgi:hypothetical protein
MMKPLDDRERRYLLIGVAAVVVVLPFLASFGALDPQPMQRAIFLLVLTSAMAYAARRRSRLLAGFSTFLLAFGPWGQAWVVGMPFLPLGMWLWFRGKPSPEEIEARRQARDARVAERRAAKEAARAERSGKPAKSSKPSGPRPERNKRYTPPKS